MTEPIEFKDEVDVPPTILDDPEFPNGSIITYEKLDDVASKEVRIRLQVRDDNIAQLLKVRTVITRANDHAVLYTCDPENELAPGAALRPWDVVIPESYISPGVCHRVDVAVSGHFARCRDDQDLAYRLFDDVEVAHSDDLARATFWIWETTNNVLGMPAPAQVLATSCPTIDYYDKRPASP